VQFKVNSLCGLCHLPPSLLQRLRFRFILRRLSLQQAHQVVGAGRHSHFVLHDNFLRGQLPAVEFFIGAAIGAQG